MKFSLTAGFGLLLALLAANCILTYRSVSMLQHDQARIADFQAVRIELGANLNAYVSAETGQRGYLLTGNEDYLAPYYAALKDLSESNVRLKNELAHFPQLDPLRAELEAEWKVKLAELERTIQLRREKGFDAALQVMHTNAGKVSMDHIRALAARIDNEQTLAMNQLLENAGDRKTRALVISTGVSAILAAALCWLFVITKRNIAERATLP